MSPLFAALPPADLPTHAYVAPTGVHGTGPQHATPVINAATSTVSDALRTHTVRDGDTLWDLARHYDVSTSALARANDISTAQFIHPGQKLRIPGSSSSGSSSSGGSSSGSSGSSSSGSSSSSSSTTTVTVRSGDTLWGIAHRHGVSVAALTSANDLRDTRMIYPGQTLRLSSGSDGTGSSSGSSNGSGAGTGSNRSSGGASTSSGSVTTPSPDGGPWTSSTIGDRYSGADVEDSFLHYRYSSATARAATANRDYLSSVSTPSQEKIRQMIVETSQRHGVDPDLMVALSYLESGWNQGAVSPANAIGAMQVIPMSGGWASSLVGRELDLLDPQDNVTAGVVIMRALQRSADSSDDAIGGYYQGLASVREHGQFADTQRYVSNIKHLKRTL